MTREITAVRRDRDRITHLRGARWEHTVEGVVSDIEAGRFRYIIKTDQQVADIFVFAEAARQPKQLRSTADTPSINRLDRLPSF